jgi:hypothetical protein
MNDLFDLLTKMKDPLMGLIIVGLFYMLWMKEKTCQGFTKSYQTLSETLVKAVTLLEMLTYGHKRGD